MSVVMIDQNVAVRVSKGCKSYGNNTILDELDMTVQAGSTYALLGSSGCGKTTLLSSLIGIRKLASGSVQLFGQDASQADISSLVGFMPQEAGLHRQLTLAEELHYYGRLYGMGWSVVEERIAVFVSLLQLEDVQDRLIRDMSGGQTRRISLAVALLHKPRLIILDEPTVGVDPLLRQSIWEHLHTLVKEEGATIILSTHYTEEARHADMVSVMRNGKLLVEENPTTLMLRYGSDLLEEVVVKLCRSQENDNCDNHQNHKQNLFQPITNIIHTMSRRRGNMENISLTSSDVIAITGDKKILDISYKKWKNSIGHSRGGTKTVPSSKKGVSWVSRHLQKIHAMFILNLILVMRNPPLLGFQISSPTFEMALTWIIYSRNPYADIGVVNLEQPNCFGLREQDEQKLGCEMSNYFHDSNALTLHEYPSEEAALDAVHWGKNYGYILFPSNYSRNFQNRVAFGRYADEEILDGSTISARLDMTNYLRNLFLFNGLLEGIIGFVDKKLGSFANGVDKDQVENFATSFEPFRSNEKMKELGAIEGTWENAAAISRTALFTWIMQTVISMALIQEKLQGSLIRTMVGGGTMEHLFIAAMASTFLTMFIAQVGLLLGTGFILGIPFKGSICDYLIVNFGQSLVGLSFGFLLGSVFNQQLEAVVVIISLGKFALLAHVMDIAAVTPWMRWFHFSLPTKVASMSIANIMFRGWSIWSNFGVWSCFVVQVPWILLSLTVARLCFGREQA